jgi:hypothetical protein
VWPNRSLYNGLPNQERTRREKRISRRTNSRKKRRAKDTSRRSMVKLTLVRNGTPMRIVLAQMKKKGDKH